MKKMSLENFEVFTALSNINANQLLELILTNDRTLCLILNNGYELIYVNKTLKDLIKLNINLDFPISLKNLHFLKNSDTLYEILQNRNLENFSFEAEVTSVNDDSFFIDFTIDSIEFDGNVSFLLIGQNITQVKNNQKKLNSFSQVFSATDDGIVITDSNGIIVWVNLSFNKITQYEFDEVIGKTPSLLKSGYHSGSFYTAMWEEITKNGYWKGHIWNKKKNGTFYQVLLTIISISHYKDNPYYVAVFKDLSDVNDLNTEIDNKENFFLYSKIGCNILQGIRKSLLLVKDSFNGIAPLTNLNSYKFENKNNIQDNINQSIDLIQEFMLLTNRNINQYSYTIESLFLNIQKLIYMNNNKKASIKFDIVDNVELYSNKIKLNNILLNIVLTAYDTLNKPDSEIILKAEKVNNMLLIEIKDNGSGITQNIFNESFEPDYNRKVGDYIGLDPLNTGSSVLHLKGNIEVISEINKGSIYKLQIPI